MDILWTMGQCACMFLFSFFTEKQNAILKIKFDGQKCAIFQLPYEK